MFKLGSASLSVAPLSQEFTPNKSCISATLQSILRPLPLLISQSRRLQRGCCRISCLPVKLQACQLSLTVAEWSQTRGKDSPFIKNSHRGRFSPSPPSTSHPFLSFFFYFCQDSMFFPQLSTCLRVCCHVLVSPQARLSGARQLCRALTRTADDDLEDEDKGFFFSGGPGGGV